jgi:hypothetical protein
MGLNGKAIAAICAVTALVLVLNYASVKGFKYPFLYCLPQPLLKPMWEPISAYGGIAIVAVMLIAGFLSKWLYFAEASALLVLFYGLPRYMEILFKLGGTCNG